MAGGFFKAGEVVVIDGGRTRYQVKQLAEAYRRGDLVQVADLEDVDGNARDGVDVERLTKVAG